MSFSKFTVNFLFLTVFGAVLFLVGLFALSLAWLPPGWAQVGHDSGLPLDAKQFLSTRLYAWDDREGFGIDNSVNFGSITIHFFDWLSSFVAGVPYAGNWFSVFFWLGLIFISALIFSYQLKDIFGKPFVFILPPLLTFNFYIFQSFFMLERAKYGVFSATLIALAAFFRMQDKKLSVVSAALISSLAFSIFNGGGLFGITLYGGVALIFGLILFSSLFRALRGDYADIKKLVIFIIIGVFSYLALNAYSILPFLQQFFAGESTALFEKSLFESNKEWLDYVSRSASFLNLFRGFGIPDWYGGWGETENANRFHPYSSLYLNNPILSVLSFLFPILAFLSFIFAKSRKQRMTLSLFGMITVLGMFLTAGSHKPLGSIFELLMQYVPGFVLYRSAFYKFGIFYLLGILVMFTFTVSFLIEKLASYFSWRWRSMVLIALTVVSVGLWFSYHWVLFDAVKVFAWKPDQSTKIKIPDYVFDFAQWTKTNDLGGKRILLVPPVNKDWQSDAYDWGYWSLSPLLYSLSSAQVLSRWHGLTSSELRFVNRLYDAIEKQNGIEFKTLAERLNVGYLLVREDVQTDSSWSPSEKPENYKRAIESLGEVTFIKKFEKWELYEVTSFPRSQLYATTTINVVPDGYLSLGNDFFRDGRSVGLSTAKAFPDIVSLSPKKMQVYDCISCSLERKANLQSFPSITILPNSIFYIFKERRDFRLLSQGKDSVSKIADYLGLVLRRTAEQKTMADLSVGEKYAIKNAETIKVYSNAIYTLLVSSPENARNFEVASMVLNYSRLVERSFSDFVRSGQARYTSQKLTDDMLGILWNIGKIKEYFSPLLLDEPEVWSNKKVYKVSLSSGSGLDLFLPVSALPLRQNGKISLPKVMELRKDNRVQTLNLEPAQDGWIKARVNDMGEGEAELTLEFEELPNLLTIGSSGLEKFAFGKAACYQGSIANFNPKRTYEVRVWKTDRLRSAKVIFRDKSFIYSENHGFIQGEDSFEIPASPEGHFARYIYSPSASAKIITLYICSDSTELPPIDKIEIRDFFTPPIIGVSGDYKSIGELPHVSYVQVNPTRYQVSVDRFQQPYVLVFNQKYNPSWKLLARSSEGRLLAVRQHFTVDDYANGWLITEPVTRFELEYAPQSIFDKAKVFSLAWFFTSVFGIAFSLIKMRTR